MRLGVPDSRAATTLPPVWVSRGGDVVGKVAKRPNTRARSIKKKAKDQVAFLAALRTCGNVFRAAKMVGIHEDMPYHWRRNDEQFAVAMEKAREEGEEVLAYQLLDEARRRGLEGIEEPHFYQGRMVGHIRRYSDNLLMFKIKGLMPQFRDNFPAIDIRSTGPTSVKIVLEGSADDPDAELESQVIDVTPDSTSEDS